MWGLTLIENSGVISGFVYFLAFSECRGGVKFERREVDIIFVLNGS